MVMTPIPPNSNFKGMSYGDWAAAWSNWLFSPYPHYLPNDDIMFLRGFLEYFDPYSEVSIKQFITEGTVNGRPAGAPRDVDSKYKDIERTTERRLILNRVYDRDESFIGEVIPKDTGIFIPIVTAMYSIGGTFEGRQLEDETDVRRAVRIDNYESRDIWAWYRQDPSADWNHIVNPLKPDYRIESPMFTLKVSEDNYFAAKAGLQPGTYDTVTGGYVIIVTGLKTGDHYFRFGARGRNQYRTEAHYLIRVHGERRDFINQIDPPPITGPGPTIGLPPGGVDVTVVSP